MAKKKYRTQYPKSQFFNPNTKEKNLLKTIIGKRVLRVLF